MTPDPSDFPRPAMLNGRFYWRHAGIDEWKAAMFRKAMGV